MMPPRLLAVDLGLRCGLACYTQQGQLAWYRSTHFPSPRALRQAVYKLLRHNGISHLVLEGGGQLVCPWQKAAWQLDIALTCLDAGQWRQQLLRPQMQTSQQQAKSAAQKLALQVIPWAQGPAPRTTLRHDSAEAILVGLYMLWRWGWIAQLPPCCHPGQKRR